MRIRAGRMQMPSAEIKVGRSLCLFARLLRHRDIEWPLGGLFCPPEKLWRTEPIEKRTPVAYSTPHKFSLLKLNVSQTVLAECRRRSIKVTADSRKIIELVTAHSSDVLRHCVPNSRASATELLDGCDLGRPRSATDRDCHHITSVALLPPSARPLFFVPPRADRICDMSLKLAAGRKKVRLFR